MTSHATFWGLMAGILLLPLSSGASGIMTCGPSGQVVKLERRIDQWLDGYNEGNVAKMMAVFGEDFIIEQQSAPHRMDKAQIAQAYTALFTAYDAHMVGTTEEICAGGNMAYDRGSYLATLTPKNGGATVKIAGHFLEVWRHEEGHWYVERLMSLNDPVN